MHSSFSNDGEFSPEDIVDMAYDRGVTTIALSDHNGVKGVPRAMTAGKAKGVKVISAIEIDCQFQGVNLHLLGYHVDPFSSELEDFRNMMNQRELDAVPQMVANLQRLGFEISYEEVMGKAGNTIPAGEFLGEILLESGKNKDHPSLIPYWKGGGRSNMPYLNFYLDFFKKGKAAYVPISFISLKDAVEMVQRNGGLPILAHPGGSLGGQYELLDGIMDLGVLGLEVFSSYHGPEETEFFFEYALERNLRYTVGSDFHGKNKPGLTIGCTDCRSLDEEILSQLSC